MAHCPAVRARASPDGRRGPSRHRPRRDRGRSLFVCVSDAVLERDGGRPRRSPLHHHRADVRRPAAEPASAASSSRRKASMKALACRRDRRPLPGLELEERAQLRATVEPREAPSRLAQRQPVQRVESLLERAGLRRSRSPGRPNDRSSRRRTGRPGSATPCPGRERRDSSLARCSHEVADLLAGATQRIDVRRGAGRDVGSGILMNPGCTELTRILCPGELAGPLPSSVRGCPNFQANADGRTRVARLRFASR